MTNNYHGEVPITSPHGNGSYYEQEINFIDVQSDRIEISAPGDAFIDTVALVEVAIESTAPLSVPFIRAKWHNSDMVNMQGSDFTILHVPLSPISPNTYSGSYHSRPVILLHKNTKRLRNASQSITLRLTGSAGENLSLNYVFARLYVRYVPFIYSENPAFMSAILTV